MDLQPLANDVEISFPVWIDWVKLVSFSKQPEASLWCVLILPRGLSVWIRQVFFGGRESSSGGVCQVQAPDKAIPLVSF